MMKKILFAFLFVLTATTAAFSATNVSNLMSQIDNNLSRFPDISQSAYEKISEFVNESLTRDPNAAFKTASYYSDPRTKQEYTVNLSFPTLASANADKIATECAKIDRIVCPNSETDGCAVGHFTQPSGCLIYIFRSPAETPRSADVSNVSVHEIIPCDVNNCDTPPQYRTREYKSIKGTIYSSDPRAGNVQNFPYRVRVTYKSDNGIHSYTSIVQPTFGFVIPAGDAGRGTVTFTVIDDRADAEYEVLTFNTDSFDSENGKSIVMKKKTATTPTRDTAPAASAGSTSTKVTGATQTFSAYLIYDANNKPGSGISGATVIDVNTGNSTKTGRGGAFTLECLFTTNTNRNSARNTYLKIAKLANLEDPDAYAERILKELPSTKAAPECFLVFTAPNQTYPYSSTITLKQATGQTGQNKYYFVYAPYQRTSNPTRTSSTSSSQSGGGNTPNVSPAGNIIISGTVYAEGTNDPAIGVAVVPEGYTADMYKTNSLYEANVANTDADGKFTIVAFPKDQNAKLTSIEYEDKIIPNNQLTQNMTIYLKPYNPGFVEDCKPTSELMQKYHATRFKLLDDECIPTECENDRILENKDTSQAVCTPCTKKIPGSLTAHANGDHCVADTCDETKYILQNGTCVSKSGQDCTAYIVHATSANFNTNGVCELQSCEDSYAVDKYALGISQKCDAVGHTNDKCNAKCEYQIGKPCNGSALKRLTGDDHADKGHVTAFVGGQITACEIDDCDSKDYEIQKGADGKNHCVRVAGTPCDVDANLPHAKTHLKGKAIRTKNDVIACEPVCWENYKAKLNGTVYECAFDKKTCPSRITNPDARKMEVTPDDKYWDVNTGDIATCKITECSDKTKVPDENGETCVKKCTKEVEEQLKSQNHALETTTNKRGECIISKCECGYNLSSDKKSCTAWGNNPPQCDKRSDPRLPDNAKKAHMACGNSTPKQAYCYIDTCESALFEIKDDDKGLKNAICVSIDSACTVTDGGQYASKEGFWELTKNGQKICVPKDCGAAVGYEVSKKTRKCVEVKKTCPDDILSKMDPKADDGVITERNSDGSVKTCQITKCKDNLDVEDGKMCVSSKCGCGQVYSGQGQCKDKDDTARQCNKGLPVHATGMGKLMCQNNNKAFNLTCAKGEKCKEVCVVQQCEDPYTPDTVNNICTAPNGNCDFEGNKDHAEDKGTWEQKSGKMVCKPICIGTNYEPDWDAQTKTYRGCVIKRDREGKRCPGDVLKEQYPHASRGEITEQDANGNATKCKITDCDRGYNLDDKNNQCVYCACGKEWDATSKSCKTWDDLNKTSCDPMPTGAKTAVRTCKDKSSGTDKKDCDDGTCTEYCKITACDTDAGYTLDEVKNECISGIGKPCTSDQLTAVDANATAGVLRKKGDKVVCVITECTGLYTPASDGSSCRPKPMLTEQQHREKIGELSENAQKMRENETSLKNRIIGAAGIGMTGIGGAMVGDALSSRAAELSAEQDMAAYLQSMYCEYGDGKTIRGGETGVELPGGNDMIDLYTQYAQLANDLKIRKDALGIRPGIESEVVIDKAETGLYDDVGTGITGGTYASIARALLYPDGPDAAKWAQMRAATDTKLKAGAIIAGVGAVGSGVANYIVNHDVKNNADEIVNRFTKKPHPITAVKNLDDGLSHVAVPTRECPSNVTTGTYPNCTCIDKKSTFNDENLACETCPDPNQTVVGNDCVCPRDMPWDGSRKACIEKETPNEAPCTPAPGNHLTVNSDGKCDCMDGFSLEESRCVCRSPKIEQTQSDAKVLCVDAPKPQEPQTILPTIPSVTTVTDTINLSANALFDLDKAIIRSDASLVLDKFVTDLTSDKTLSNCTIDLVGYTDPLGSNSHNLDLSQRRSAAVKEYLVSRGIVKALKNQNASSITTNGQGEANCKCYEDKLIEACKSKTAGTALSGNDRYSPCRRVELTITCQQTTNISQTINDANKVIQAAQTLAGVSQQ